MDDLISRQDAIDALKMDISIIPFAKAREYVRAAIDTIYNRLEELPSAQRMGKWIATQEWGGRNYSCSCCKFSFMVDTCMYEPMWNFCPNCGAEMKGEEE